MRWQVDYSILAAYIQPHPNNFIGQAQASRRASVKYVERLRDKVELRVFLFSSLEREPGSASPALLILYVGMIESKKNKLKPPNFRGKPYEPGADNRSRAF